MPRYHHSASLLVGKTIDNGTLRIEAILGSGSFGVVYRAVDTRTGALYAVKRVEKAGPGWYQTREMEIHARVSAHPHVVTFHREFEAGRHASSVTFFREDELIKRVFVQIIDALEHCHARGVYHRDLKPENILVSAGAGDIDAFIADFGLATTNKVTSTSCGTPCFMSPESLGRKHKAYSAESDDNDFADFIIDRTIICDVLPLSDAAFRLLRGVFSMRPERRPSLAALRAQVLAIDTFFLTDCEARCSGWADRMNLQALRKKYARKPMPAPPAATAPKAVAVSSSASVYSSTSSEDSSAPSSPLPATPPPPVHIEAVRASEALKAPTRLDLAVAAAQTC
ncbi:kinase-like domain-containing protein [Gloeopeniophorella convolvens]|nr:kinase-like domain-containing protein [Gloeopeniophorella convolvens]